MRVDVPRLSHKSVDSLVLYLVVTNRDFMQIERAFACVAESEVVSIRESHKSQAAFLLRWGLSGFFNLGVDINNYYNLYLKSTFEAFSSQTGMRD